MEMHDGVFVVWTSRALISGNNDLSIFGGDVPMRRDSERTPIYRVLRNCSTPR